MSEQNDTPRPADAPDAELSENSLEDVAGGLSIIKPLPIPDFPGGGCFPPFEPPIEILPFPIKEIK